MTVIRRRWSRSTSQSPRSPLASAGLTHMVTRLERDRLVERAVDPADRRSFLVRLTPDGRAWLYAARVTPNAVIRAQFTARLNEDQLQELAGVWDTLLR